MLELLTMEADNFISYEHVERSYPPGLWFIQGINEDDPERFSSNGSGKTTLSEIIKWGLTGETSKDVFVDDVVNWKHGKNCQVSLSGRSDGMPFTINRYRKHEIYGNECHVFKDGKQEERDSETVIRGILKMSPKLFFHSCFLSQEFTQNFVSMNGAGRRSIFEESFRLDTLAVAYIIAKKKYDDISKDIQSYYTVIARLQEEIETEESSILELNSLKEQWDSEVEIRNRETQNQVNVLKLEIESYQDEIKKKEPSLVEKVQRLRQQSAALSSMKLPGVGEPCPICRKTFTKADHDKLSPKNLDGATLNKSLICTELIDAESELALINQKKMLMNQKIGTVQALSQKKESDQDNPYAYQMRVRDIALEARRKTLGEHQQTVANKVFDQLTAEYWTSAFAPTGPLRMSIIQYYLPILNSSLKKYSTDIFGDRWAVLLEGYKYIKSSQKFKEDLEVKIMRDGEVKRYNNLSTGQKCRVDLAIFLAYQEVIFKFTQPINILMIDEAFAAVDPAGVKTLIEMLLRNLPPNRCVDFVTQNMEYAGMFTKRLVVTMRNDVSTLEEIIEEEKK